MASGVVAERIALMQRAVKGRSLWDDARRRRVALLHATRPLAEVHTDLPVLARQLNVEKH